MKRYPAYKDSGAEWIGEIPNHWKILKLKYISKIANGATPSTGNAEYWDGDIFWVTPSDISKIIGNRIVNTERKITLKGLESCGTTLIPSNSIILTTRAPIGNVVINYVELCTNQGCKAIIIYSGDTTFHYYQLLNFNKVLDSFGSGTTFKELSSERLKNYDVISPLPSEQSKIATFLNHKTSQIDDLIKKKLRLIELLKEERTAIINKVLTKGLDPQVLMKNSGIVWLGEIPEHWLVKRIKFLVDNIIEKSNTSGFKVALENIESWTGRYLKTESPSELTGEMKSFKPNDVLFNKLRPYLAKVYLSEVEGECVGELLVLRPQAYINPKFLYYRLLSRDFIEVVNSSTYGAKMPRASWEDFIRNLIIPYPDILEQEMIVESIEKMSVTIERTIIKLEHEIELISEYKTSLINEAVTGKIKVSDAD